MTIQNVGTPDWQRGVVGTQKLLATVPAGVNEVTVSIPPNSEAVIIAASSYGPSVPPFNVVGNQSGTIYSAFRVPREVGDETTVFVVTVSPTIDQTITISSTVSPPKPWSVISESAGRYVVDMSTAAVSGNTDEGVGISGILIMGEDTLNRSQFVMVDSSRRIITAGATSYSGQIGVPAGVIQVLPAPASGHYYLHHADIMNTSGVALRLNIENGTGAVIAATIIPPLSTLVVDLDGLAIADQINARGAAVGGGVTLRYSQGY